MTLPYGGGLFFQTFFCNFFCFVPSLLGRIVLFIFSRMSRRWCSVPTWTDCSQEGNQESNQAMSCPYGDGLFFRRPFCLLRVLVPSLRGRIVPNPPLLEIFILHPVPTGADCSNFIILDFGMGVSRPYWDGLFLMASFKYLSTAFS